VTIQLSGLPSSSGDRRACSPQVYIYLAQGSGFSHYLAQDAG